MMADANLPQKFWAETLSTAVYLCDHSPTKAVPDMTTYEARRNQEANLENLRVFGCLAYSHINKDKRQKLDSKTKKVYSPGLQH